MRIYWVQEIGEGSLGMMARPKGGDWLDDEISELSNHNVDMVVSLLEYEEIHELGIEREKELCQLKNIQYINYPISDRGIPTDETSFLDLISMISKGIQSGLNVVVHCRMGIGRTGLVAAAVVLNKKLEIANVFDYLSEIRTIRMPDTTEQIEWITNLKNKFQRII